MNHWVEIVYEKWEVCLVNYDLVLYDFNEFNIYNNDLY